MIKLSNCNLFTMDEFKKKVSNGSINSYDGVGYYSDGENNINIGVDLRNIDDKYSHVMWYVKRQEEIIKKITFEEFMQQKHYRGGNLVELPDRKLTDEEIEEIWSYLEDIPITDDELLDDDYFIWSKGSDKYEDVWRWFDDNYSKGVAFLVNEWENKEEYVNNKGCKYCNDEDFENHEKLPATKWIDNQPESSLKVYSCGTLLFSHNDGNTAIEHEVEVDYCPKCGRKFKKNRYNLILKSNKIKKSR